jgi:hypothetical protein
MRSEDLMSYQVYRPCPDLLVQTCIRLVGKLLLNLDCFRRVLLRLLVEYWTWMRNDQANDRYAHHPGQSQLSRITPQWLYLRALQPNKLRLLSEIRSKIPILQLHNSIDASHQDEHDRRANKCQEDSHIGCKGCLACLP